jgi:hypothetical protein
MASLLGDHRFGRRRRREGALVRAVDRMRHAVGRRSWCALAFLRDCHPDPAVVADARRGLRRLDHE